MTPDELQARTKQFSLRTMKLADSLSTGRVGARELAKQLVRSGMSVSANYRAARRGRSRKEFIAKLGVVIEEADETLHWLELCMEGGYMRAALVQDLQKEARELVAIFTRAGYTARANASVAKVAVTLPNYQIANLPNGSTKKPKEVRT